MSKNKKGNKNYNKKGNKKHNHSYIEVSDEIKEMMSKEKTFNDIKNIDKVEEVDLSKYEQPSMSEQMMETIPEKLKETTTEEVERLEKLQEDLKSFGKKKDYDPDEELELTPSIQETADQILEERKQAKKEKKAKMREEMNLPPEKTKKEIKEEEKRKKKEARYANETEEERKARLSKKAAKQKAKENMKKEAEKKQQNIYDIIDNFGKKPLKDKDTKSTSNVKETEAFDNVNNNNKKILKIICHKKRDTKFALALNTIKEKYEKLEEEKDSLTEGYFESAIVTVSKLMEKLVDCVTDTEFVQTIKTLADVLIIEDLFAETMEADLNALCPGETIDEIVISSIIETVKFNDKKIKKEFNDNVKDYNSLLTFISENTDNIQNDCLDFCDKLLATSRKSNFTTLENAFNREYIQFKKGDDIAKLLISKCAVANLPTQDMKDYIIDCRMPKKVSDIEKVFIDKVTKYKNNMK